MKIFFSSLFKEQIYKKKFFFKKSEKTKLKSRFRRTLGISISPQEFFLKFVLKKNIKKKIK